MLMLVSDLSGARLGGGKIRGRLDGNHHRWRASTCLATRGETSDCGPSGAASALFLAVAPRHEVSTGLLWTRHQLVRRRDVVMGPTPVFMPALVIPDPPPALPCPSRVQVSIEPEDTRVDAIPGQWPAPVVRHTPVQARGGHHRDPRGGAPPVESHLINMRDVLLSRLPAHPRAPSCRTARQRRRQRQSMTATSDKNCGTWGYR